MNARALWLHMRGLWPKWTLLPAAPFVFWPLYCFAIGEHRWELVALMLVGTILPYKSARTKKLYLGVLPILLVAVLYDMMRFIKNVGLHTVHICDLRALEIRLFGITLNGEPATVHDWWNLHSSTALDLFCAIPYGTFLGAAVAFAIFLYIKDYRSMQRFTWSFFFLNMLGFATYHLYPAAPPWYFHKYGCVVNLLAKASEGPHLAHVDQILGFHYFGGFYGRSNDVFGAVPSLHVSYPLLIAIYGWRNFAWWGRAASIFFYFWMCFAAVYLDHHWIFDVMLGTTYTFVVAAIVITLTRQRTPAPAV